MHVSILKAQQCSVCEQEWRLRRTAVFKQISHNIQKEALKPIYSLCMLFPAYVILHDEHTHKFQIWQSDWCWQHFAI